MASIGYSDHSFITTSLQSLIAEVDKYKQQVGHGPDGQALAVLHTDLRKCLAWCSEIPAVQDEIDKSDAGHDPD